jgi:multimeric flavodoxin WrbA
MKLTIINGIPNESYAAFEEALENLRQKLSEQNEVDLFKVRDMNISYCCGCFSCWLKTPGLCIFKDDMELVLKSMAKTDFTIYVSPIKAGFVTALTKKVMDRFIPTALPYIKIYKGECHHPKRYDNNPGLGLVILNEDGIELESVAVTNKIFERLSLNMHAPKFFKVLVKEDEMGVIQNEFTNC